MVRCLSLRAEWVKKRILQGILIAGRAGMPLYSRHSLIHTIIERQRFDDAFNNFNKSLWYEVGQEKLVNTMLQKSFIQSTYDAETAQFIKRSQDLSDSVFLQMYYNLATFMLSWFMTKTSINGLVGRGSMFLFSHDQLRSLLAGCTADVKCGRLLDLGAGDGAITSYLAKFFAQVDVTEASTPMIWQLQRRGFGIVDVNNWTQSAEEYNLISCLNLLDRHPKPLSLLRVLREQVTRTADGKVLLAVVLPWSQYCEFGEDGSKLPSERIAVKGDCFEQQAENFVAEVLVPAGFEVLRWTRLPYLCEGDNVQSFYVLDCAVFVLKGL